MRVKVKSSHIAEKKNRNKCHGYVCSHFSSGIWFWQHCLKTPAKSFIKEMLTLGQPMHMHWIHKSVFRMEKVISQDQVSLIWSGSSPEPFVWSVSHCCQPDIYVLNQSMTEDLFSRPKMFLTLAINFGINFGSLLGNQMYRVWMHPECYIRLLQHFQLL